MIADHRLACKGIRIFIEPPQIVSDRRFKHHQLVGLDWSQLAQQLLIEWEQVLVVIDPWTEIVVWVFPHVGSRRLIQQVISNHVRLPFEIADDINPHPDELVSHPPFVAEKVRGKFHDIFSGIEPGKPDFMAVCLQRISIRIIPQRYVQGRGKSAMLNQPVWKPLPAEPPAVQVMMGIEDDSNLVSFSRFDDLAQLLEIAVVVLTFLGLKTLPAQRQSYSLEAPVSQVCEILPRQRIVGVELLSSGVVGESLIDGVDSVQEDITAIRISEHRSRWVD